MEQRTARLTILVDPRKKAVFERLCAEDDVTPSQVLRRLIREFIESKTGQPWVPEQGAVSAAPEHETETRSAGKAGASRRRPRRS
jgi:hypothetical protein